MYIGQVEAPCSCVYPGNLLGILERIPVRLNCFLFIDRPIGQPFWRMMAHAKKKCAIQGDVMNHTYVSENFVRIWSQISWLPQLPVVTTKRVMTSGFSPAWLVLACDHWH